MQFHNLKRKNPNKKTPRVGRGGKRGKTSGRGTKGQNARSGRKKRPEMRDVIKRYPKLRGRGISGLKSIQIKPFGVNVGILDKHFKAGEIVSTATLAEKGLINKVDMRVKILGNGELKAGLTFEGVDASATAKQKIESAGGKI